MLTEIPFTVADQLIIDALPDETRAVVERYAQSVRARLDHDAVARGIDEIGDAIAEELSASINGVVRRALERSR